MIMETLFVFLNVQISLRIGNLQLAAWDWIIRKKKAKQNKKKKQNCIKSRLPQFLFLQQKM